MMTSRKKYRLLPSSPLITEGYTPYREDCQEGKHLLHSYPNSDYLNRKWKKLFPNFGGFLQLSRRTCALSQSTPFSGQEPTNSERAVKSNTLPRTSLFLFLCHILRLLIIFLPSITHSTYDHSNSTADQIILLSLSFGSFKSKRSVIC